MAHITERTIKRLEVPTKGNRVEYDDEIKGFGVRITSAGVRSFVLNYRINGRERRYTIGRFPDFSATAARSKAIELRGMIARGSDPLETRQQTRSAPTVKELAADYIERHAKPRKRPRSIQEDQSMIDGIILPAIGSRKVLDVRRRDIESLHQSLKRTPYRANRVLALVSTMFNLAVKWDWISGNPAKGVDKFPEERRERWLQTNELRHLTSVLASYPNQRAANAIRMLILTGARRSEVLTVEWSHIDFERGVWTKPSHHTKQKKTEHVPLSAATMDLLTRIKSQAPHGNPYIFPGDPRRCQPVAGVAPEHAPLTDIKGAWKRIKSAATVAMWKDNDETSALVTALASKLGREPTIEEIEDAAKEQMVMLPESLMDVRLHDLRHTYASHLVSSGLSLEIIGRLLGHTQITTTKRYAHIADDPLRAATNRMGAIVQSGEATDTANVVSLNNAQIGDTKN